MMWQRHGVPMEEFLNWSYRKKAAYIASELVESENPVRKYKEVW